MRHYFKNKGLTTIMWHEKQYGFMISAEVEKKILLKWQRVLKIRKSNAKKPEAIFLRVSSGFFKQQVFVTSFP